MQDQAPATETAPVTTTEESKLTSYEEAGATYAGQLNYFRKLVRRKGMSSKKLARVFIAAAEFPLGETPRLLDEEERFMFQLFHAVQNSKNIFLEELMKKDNPPSAEGTASPDKKENTDG